MAQYINYIANVKKRPDGYPINWVSISLAVKEEAKWRCVRCGHDSESPGIGNRKSCTPHCDLSRHPEGKEFMEFGVQLSLRSAPTDLTWPSQRQRMLTVHHLDMNKTHCIWWNIIALCQVCHLSIQARVEVSQNYMFSHSEWFKPYVAGYYAFIHLGELLSRKEVMKRMDELLALAMEDNSPQNEQRIG